MWVIYKTKKLEIAYDILRQQSFRTNFYFKIAPY